MKKRIAAGGLAVILMLMLAVGILPGASAAFTDISDPDVEVAAATLQGLGVVNGTGGTNFQPNNTLTRAEVCTMAVKAMGLAGQVNSYARKTVFADVAPDSWYNGYVNLAYAKGIINGYGNGKFGPGDEITYGQIATILLRMLGYTTADIGSVWPMDFTNFADDLGLSEGLKLDPMNPVTRGEAAVLFYHAMKETVKGSSKAYYETISGLSSSQEGILLDVDAAYGGNTGMLLFYATGSNGGMDYYEQVQAQSDALEGSVGTLLFNGSGEVIGFVPKSSSYTDVTIGNATATTLKSVSGTSWRIPGDALVVMDGETYSYRTSGYLQLQNKSGENVRLFCDESGVISHLYLAGGTASSSEAAVAATTSAQSALAGSLGLSGNYSITKNGAVASGTDLAQYDVGYYDKATGTLRVSDYKVTGYLSAASPNLSAASTVTVAGYTFDVLECAWDTLGSFRLGDKVTLLLTDDCKVAAVYSASKLSAEMVGVLDKNGKSVTLIGSGITLSAGTVESDKANYGGLVRVYAGSATTLRCYGVSSASAGTLNMTAGTLGELKLAPSIAVYEWAGVGYVYDLEGNLASSSSGFGAIDWTASLSSSYVSYYHVNSAGKVDAVLLRDVTGNCFSYGSLSTTAGTVSAGMQADRAGSATLTNGSGNSSRYVYTLSGKSNGYVGIALAQGQGGERVATVKKLTSLGDVENADFFRRDGDWYIAVDGAEYRLDDTVQVNFCKGSESMYWSTREDGLLNAMADGYTLRVYCDRTENGGQIRVISATVKS